MIIDIIASIMGILMSLGYYPQAYKILRHKSARSVSVLSYVIFGIGTVTWLVYGILIHSLTIILSFALGAIGSWLVLILIMIYGRKKG